MMVIKISQKIDRVDSYRRGSIHMRVQRKNFFLFKLTLII